jgi:hypothetical protein
MVPSRRPGPAGRTADPGLSGCETRDRARRSTAVLLAEVQMLQDLKAVGDKQREEISGHGQPVLTSVRGTLVLTVFSERC